MQRFFFPLLACPAAGHLALQSLSSFKDFPCEFLLLFGILFFRHFCMQSGTADPSVWDTLWLHEEWKGWRG